MSRVVRRIWSMSDLISRNIKRKRGGDCMKYTVTYILDQYDYEWENGYRADDYFAERSLANGEWVLSEEEFNAENLRSLIMDVFNRFAPYNGEVLDRHLSYVIDALVENDSVMIEYDMCVSVLREGDSSRTGEQLNSFYKLFE